MADRNFHNPETQGIKHVTYSWTSAGAAVVTNPPLFVEGDIAGASVGAYVTATKVATGKYRFTTKDAFPGCVSFKCNLAMAAPTGNSYLELVKPVQNANGTWQLDVYVYVNAAGAFSLADLASGDQLHCDLVLRNSGVKP